MIDWKEAAIPERRRAVVPLIEEGLSASQMAARLKTTRNAIIGFCHRHGIPMTPQAPRELLPPAPDDPPLAGSTPTSLMDTTGCRWPVQGGFCNNPRHMKSYCETHYAKAYKENTPGY